MGRHAPIAAEPAARDLTGPNGRQLIVHLVINAESWAFDRPMPRQLLGTPHGAAAVPDVANYSWVAYGVRRGLPRMLALLRDRGLRASVALNASLIEDYPEAAAQIAESGYELIGHGIEQQSAHSLGDEATVIAESIRRLEALGGGPVRGWLGPGLQATFGSLDQYSAAGLEYVSDWSVDDVPLWLEARPRRLLALPYSLELNDSVLFAAHDFPTEEYLYRLAGTLACLERELDEGARVLALPLHPHLLGAPHRLGALERALAILQARADSCFLSGSEIHDWFVGATAKR